MGGAAEQHVRSGTVRRVTDPQPKCGAGSQGALIRTLGHEGLRTAGSARSIHLRRCVCHDLGSHRAGRQLLTSGAWSRRLQRVRIIEVRNTRRSTPAGSSRHADEAEIRAITELDPYFLGMLINHDPLRYEALAAPTASLSQYESQPLERRYVTNMRRELPAHGLPAVPPRTWSEDDTPVYWQTVQAMASGRRRRRSG